MENCNITLLFYAIMDIKHSTSEREREKHKKNININKHFECILTDNKSPTIKDSTNTHTRLKKKGN